MHAGLNIDPGFLSLDTDGRVIRIDTFSKILAPGFRLAWITATPAVLKHCLSATFLPTFGAAGMSQAIVYSMLNTWGFDGFDAYLRTVQVCTCLFLLPLSHSRVYIQHEVFRRPV